MRQSLSPLPKVMAQTRQPQERETNRISLPIAIVERGITVTPTLEIHLPATRP